MENAEPIKVSRGRPRKPRPLEEEEENDVVEKKGRGRPRIHPIKDPKRQKIQKNPYGGIISHYTSNCIIKIDQKLKQHVCIVEISLIQR